MATTSPTRIDDEVFASAQVVGEVMGRSASQQVTHWARIGRALETSTTVSHRDIAEVLAGQRAYDELDGDQQAVVRAAWEERAATLRGSLDLAAEFAASGDTYSTLDDDGGVIAIATGRDAATT